MNSFYIRKFKWKFPSFKKFNVVLMPFTLFNFSNYKIDKYLDKYLNEMLNYGIAKIEPAYCYMNITFNNGIKAYLWDTNRWYAWLSQGYIDDVHFKDKSVRNKTKRRLRRLMNEYYENNPKQDLKKEFKNKLKEKIYEHI